MRGAGAQADARAHTWMVAPHGLQVLPLVPVLAAERAVDLGPVHIGQWGGWRLDAMEGIREVTDACQPGPVALSLHICVQSWSDCSCVFCAFSACVALRESWGEYLV